MTRTAPSTRLGRALLRGGFSLVEVLIVAGILALLAALLAPALGLAIDEAMSARCRNQLRQIGMAYGMYLRDSGGVWPPIRADERPAALLGRIEKETGLKAAPAQPADGWGLAGPHWSIVLWPYIGDISIYTCPSDPKAGLRGSEVLAPGVQHTAAFLDAPPESYALNVILFRTDDDMRRMAGCTWGTRGDVDFSGSLSCTTEAEQRRIFPNFSARILFFCGASGETFGSQHNITFRTCGLVDRWDWHPRRASAPFVDEPGSGSNYLFVDSHVEYRDELPGLWEWGYDLGREPKPPKDEKPPEPPAAGTHHPSLDGRRALPYHVRQVTLSLVP